MSLLITSSAGYKGAIMITSNYRGLNFESIIFSLLNMLENSHHDLVKITKHPKIKLLNGTEVIPDFELIYELPHQKEHRLIECQDRSKSSQEIVRKIRDMKSLSPKNRFIFLYKEDGYLSNEVRKALDSDGIVYYNFREFCAFLQKLNETLTAVSHTPLQIDFSQMAYSFLDDLFDKSLSKQIKNSHSQL